MICTVCFGGEGGMSAGTAGFVVIEAAAGFVIAGCAVKTIGGSERTNGTTDWQTDQSLLDSS